MHKLRMQVRPVPSKQDLQVAEGGGQGRAIRVLYGRIEPDKSFFDLGFSHARRWV